MEGVEVVEVNPETVVYTTSITTLRVEPPHLHHSGKGKEADALLIPLTGSAMSPEREETNNDFSGKKAGCRVSLKVSNAPSKGPRDYSAVL